MDNFLVAIIITGCVYVLPVLAFRMSTGIRIKSHLLAGIITILYGSIVHVLIQYIFYREIVSQVPSLWILVCFYILNSSNPMLSDKEQQTETKNTTDNEQNKNSASTEKTTIDEDGTIIIEQPNKNTNNDAEQQTPVKYKTKKKLKLLVAGLCFALTLSLIGNCVQAQKINERDTEIQNLSTAYTDFLENTYKPIFKEFAFYHSYAVIVQDGVKYYHTYNCPAWNKEKGFYIYNFNNAKNYRNPCPDCKPPQ